MYVYALTGLPLCVDTENTTARHVEHTLSESLPIQTHFLINDEEKIALTHLDRTFIESPQKEVILESSDWYAFGRNNISSLPKLAVILDAMIFQL